MYVYIYIYIYCNEEERVKESHDDKVHRLREKERKAMRTIREKRMRS